MSIEVVHGTNQKPVSSEALVGLMYSQTDWVGQLFIGYPIMGTAEGRYLIDALLISADKGIVVFDLIDGTDPHDYEQRQDDSANKLEARLRSHKELVRRRDLLIPIHVVSFAPGVRKPSSHAQDGYPLANGPSLIKELTELSWEEPDEEIYRRTLSVIENVSTIRKSKRSRKIAQSGSRGDTLRVLENSIATLDNTQSKAVIETVEGVQRIRGLAGSGKTIVLALKAAYLHAQHPEWRIAVTFHTRSLKDHFRRLINNFSIEQTGEEPDWVQLRIINAWGGRGGGDRDGIYHEFCHENDVVYFDFNAARGRYGSEMAFRASCDHALGEISKSKQLYDAILLDEAQDLPPAFLRLCYEMLKPPKRLVYAYDELQGLSGESLPSPEEIFGRNNDGSPKVKFDNLDGARPKQDIILAKCYRNSRPVLVTAHAVGFGIYRQPREAGGIGLVQMFDHPQLWDDIGYQQRHGELKEGHSITLSRPEETSPKFLEDHSELDDLIQFICFDNEEEQANWLTDAIKKNLSEDELRHDDIIVINPDPLKTRKVVGPIRARLLKGGINSHLAGVDTGADVFFLESPIDSVTFTGVHRAKGNEAGMVYIINAQDCHTAARNLATIRNRLFTAITRSKAWVRVLGFGSDMNALIGEYNRLRDHNFELDFTYPTVEQREQLKVIHRDMTTEENKQRQRYQNVLTKLVEDLEAGRLQPEDLDEVSRAKLRQLLE